MKNECILVPTFNLMTMKKFLLAVGLMAACLSSSAQKVFEYGFETPSSELSPQKLEYINFKTGDSRDTIVEGRNGGLAVKLMNVDSIVGNNWERAVKIRTLGLEPNTPYRVSFWMKGSQVYGASNTATNVRTRLMVGRENADVPVVATGNAAYDYTSTSQDSVNWKKYTYLFFYSDDAIQEAYFKTQKPDSVFNNDHFLCLNIFNPGEFYLDDILVEKSSIRGFSFNGYAIKVDFGYGVNFSGLTSSADYNIVKLPTDAVTVKYDGVETPVLSVEVQQSGLIIFLDQQFLGADDEGKVSISFNNPTDPKLALKYNDAKRPYSWDPTSDMRVLNFADETGGKFDENLIPVSVDDMAPYLKKVTPENKSFELPLESRVFKLVYSKKVDAESAAAVMAGPAGTFALELAETGVSDTLTFSVPQSKQLANGSYRITVSGIVSENLVDATANDIIDLEYGPSTAGEPDTLLNANADFFAAGRERIPAGWRLQLGTEITGDTVVVSKTAGIRTFVVKNSKDQDFTAGVYLSSRSTPNEAMATYGTFDKFRLHMKPGKYVIKFNVAYWENTDRDNNINKSGFRLKDTDGNIIFEEKNLLAKSSIAGAWNNDAYLGGSQLHVFTALIPEEKDYLAQWFFQGNGFEANFLGGFKIISIPSEAYIYKQMVAQSVDKAIEAVGKLDSFIYDGTAKNNVQSMIQYGQTYHSSAPSDWVKTSADIDAAVVLMNTHKTNIDNYYTALNNSKTTVANNVGTIYAQSVNYDKLAAFIVSYDSSVINVDSDLDLIAAKDSLTYYYNRVQGAVNSTVPLKFRINKSVTLAESLPIRIPAAELQAAKAAYTDDDAIAEDLKVKLKAYVEANIADNSITFLKDTVGMNLDSTASANLKVTNYLDMTGFIKNPNLYTREKVDKHLTDNLFPGWKTKVTRGNPEVTGTLASDINPVVASHIVYYGPGTSTEMQQEITGLPNGVYTVGFSTRMPTNYNDVQGSNPIRDAYGNPWTLQTIADSMGIFAICNDDTLRSAFYPTGHPGAFSNLSTNTYINDLLVTDGKLTIGYKNGVVPVFTPTIFLGNPVLRLMGKDPNYTYVNPVKNVQNAAAVKEVQYFNIQGARLSAPAKGLNIVKTIYSNGASKVEKIMIK